MGLPARRPLSEKFLDGRSLGNDEQTGVLARPPRDETDALRAAPGIRRKIQAVALIAAAHGSSISSAETLLLLPTSTFESIEELESFVETDPILSGHLVVSRGQIAMRNAGNFGVRPNQLGLSERRGLLAQSFTDRLAAWCPWIRLVGLSGSTAYGAAKPSDDIDLFIVTGRNRLWITLLVAMAAARIHRMRNPGWPVLCLNRILEEDVAREEFGRPQDALFAREALSMRVLRGSPFYRELVKSARWMQRIFPELSRRATTEGEGRPAVFVRHPGRLWSLANGIAFAVLAPYLTMVGFWRNRRLLQEGNVEARYRTIIERGFFAYESRKYDNLRRTYREAFE